jgi:hypothetical protein
VKTKSVQSNFLSGVLDERASGRIETDAYNQGLLVGRNIELHHLGGARRRRGLQHKQSLNNVLTRQSATVTCPNGGTTANANDDSTATSVTTTTPVGTTNEFVVVSYDLGSLQTITAADVLGIATVSGSSTEFRFQVSTDGVSWVNVGTTAQNFELVDTTPRDYRRTVADPARYIRVSRVGVTNLPSNITLTGMNIWVASAVVSDVRLLPFEVSNSRRFLVALTDRSATILENGTVVDRVPMPYASADLREIDADASEGELVLTHEDYAPRALFEEDEGNFQSFELEFSNIPQIDFNDTMSPTPTSCVQTITLGGTWAVGDTLQVDLEGARSGTIAYAGDTTAAQQTATANNIARAIQKLYTVPGFQGVTCTRSGALTYTVTFADGSAKNYQLMTVLPVVSAAGTVSVALTTPGVARTEDLWSATRGWPRTVAFYEKRIYLGGTRDRPQSLLGSHVVDTLNFDLAEGLDDEAIFVSISGQQTNVIQGIMSGDALQVFTTGGEFRYLKRDGEPITPADVPKNQSNNGSKRIRPVLADGRTIYVHQTGKALLDFKYNLDVDKYSSLSLTSLAPHLLDDVVDIAAWNGSQEDELNFVFAVNSDGTVAVLNLRQEAEVKAVVQWTTQGEFKAVACVLQDIYFAVLRDIDGTDTLFLEQLAYDYYTDCATKQTGAATDTVTGLSYLNGVECRVRADGYSLPRETPSAGAVVLDDEYEDIEVGLNFDPEVTPMPLHTLTPNGSNFMDKRRVVRVSVLVRDSLGILCNGRVLPDRQFDVNNFDEAPVPVSRVHQLEESTNWDFKTAKTVSFTQVDPMPMEILAIQVQLESE